MPDDFKGQFISNIQGVLQWIVAGALVAAGLGLAAWTALGAAGSVPMLSVPAVVGVNPVDAGPLLQIGAAIVLLAIVALLPGLARVRRLEAAHRSFRVGMEDVSRAYWAAHAADRAGLFALGREFDAVRERLEFLRRHPDLGAHEPELLELAAQMSAEARELAAIYSDEKVARAETMLAERRMEVERLTGLVERAHGVTRDLRRALDEVTLDEDVARARIDRLREEIGALWEEIERGGGTPATTGPRLRLAAE